MKSIRQTILNEYKRCSYMCKLNWGETYEEGKCEVEGGETNKYALVGIALHEVMEVWGINKKNNNVGIVGDEYYHELIDIKLDLIEDSYFDDLEDKENYRVSLHEQLDWLLEQADSNEILFNEYKFSYEGLINEVDLPIVGTIDRIDGNLEAKRATLIDYKTGKAYTKKSLKTNIQAFLYTLAFYREFNFLPEKFVFYFSKHKKKMVIWITPEFLQEAGAEVLSIWFKMKRQEFEPNCDSKYFCKNFCKHQKECPKYKKVPSGWSKFI